MLKSRIDEAAFAALPEALKGEYKKIGNHYVLDTDEAEELRNAAAAARNERDTIKSQLDAANAAKAKADQEAEEARTEAARKAGDMSAVEASWKTKLDDAAATAKAERKRLEGAMEVLLVDNVAVAICAEISTAPTLMLPHVKALLKGEISEENGVIKPVTRVLDKDGKISAKNLDELKADLIANPDFAAIIVGSKANGGADNRHSSGGAGSKKISEMTEAERVALHRQVGGAEYNRRLALEKQSAA